MQTIKNKDHLGQTVAQGPQDLVSSVSYRVRFIVERLRQMDKTEIAARLSTLAGKSIYYPQVIIDLGKQFELLVRQKQAYCWLLATEQKLVAYLASVRKLLAEATGDNELDKVDLLQFLDLPRPPVLYMSMRVLSDYARLAVQIIDSPYCTDELCRELEIDLFANAFRAMQSSGGNDLKKEDQSE